ncbi:PTS transporter subunit EIIC [Desemzia sp. RIT804]|uniref:PTS transporter subunit EIIC n=1 Tax=Desemzia sp. RIT 804 TaxID=2810209 RepID=UPI00195068CE|nr:PTS transporter subunit EIIC [Desemzia sp. RIT 804]MBM6615320.1 PTS transporter subunit EIIC [Desemzia sp. RIT 804]
MKKKVQSFFSLLGKSFLPAIAVMSLFALLLSIGAVLKNPYFIESVPFLGNQAIQFIATLLNESGLIVIKFMPLVFALSISTGLASKEDKGLAGLSALIGYLFMISISAVTISFLGLGLEPEIVVNDNNIVTISQTLDMRTSMQNMVLGLQTTDTGVLGGILVGIVAAWATKKFKNQKLPVIFSFYQGKNFPPIITGMIFIVVGVIIPFVWPILGGGIFSVAGIVTDIGVFGSFIFGLVERLLIPTGLHHVWYSIVHFTPVGGTLDIGGQVYTGTKAITTAALSNPDFQENISEITRLWLGQGATPIKVFGIPAACMALYAVAEDKNKAKTIAISAAMASMFAGVTEPFEFMFMFLAPGLFVIHAVLSGLSFAILDYFDASYLGSNNIIELFVNGFLQGHKSTWIPIVLVGLLMGVIYFLLFRWYILKFDVKVPGRIITSEEQNILVENEEPQSSKNKKISRDKDLIAKQVIKAVGGEGNIKDYTNCISRLRVYVKDPSKVSNMLLESIPESMGVVRPSEEEIHIVFGMKVDEYRQAVDLVLENS